MFINDLSLSLQCYHLFFANDLKLFSNISAVEDCALLYASLAYVGQWYFNSKFTLNANKCKICFFTLKFELFVFDYWVNSVTLASCNSVRDLGVLLDNKLDFTEHIDQIISKAYKSLEFIDRNSTSQYNSFKKSVFFIYLL